MQVTDDMTPAEVAYQGIFGPACTAFHKGEITLAEYEREIERAWDAYFDVLHDPTL